MAMVRVNEAGHRVTHRNLDSLQVLLPLTGQPDQMWASMFKDKAGDKYALVTELPEGPPLVRLTVPWTVGAKSAQERYDDVASRVAALVELVAEVDAECNARTLALDALESLLDPERVITN
jgi:hypothetical protein